LLSHATDQCIVKPEDSSWLSQSGLRDTLGVAGPESSLSLDHQPPDPNS
jgi:hypothetical protein